MNPALYNEEGKGEELRKTGDAQRQTDRLTDRQTETETETEKDGGGEGGGGAER